MSKPKKLDIEIEKLKEIARALNENTIKNRSRRSEDKIPTDKFIRQFNILRKDFSETIKGTCISYNRQTFLYDINEEVSNINEMVINTGVEDNKVNEVTTSNNKVTMMNTSSEIKHEKQIDEEVTKGNNEVTKNSSDIIKALKEEVPELFDMIEWYKDNSNAKVSEDKKINIDHEKLSGESMVRSFKTYKGVLDEFGKFCKGRSETQKDLLAMALIEFMEKHK